MKRSLLALSCSLLLACGGSSWVMAEPTPITPDVVESVDTSQNQFVQNDRHAFFLKGDVKQYTANIYYFDYADLSPDLQPTVPDALGFSIHADFNRAGFSDYLRLGFYHSGELSFAVYRSSTPYENNERKIYSVKREANESHDKEDIQQALAATDVVETVTQFWKDQTSTTIIKEGAHEIIESFNESHRPTFSVVHQSGDKTEHSYHYLSFAALQNMHFDALTANTIEVSATREDLKDFTIADFRALDPRIRIVVKESLDAAGNPLVQWNYTSNSLDKEVLSYQYY